MTLRISKDGIYMVLPSPENYAAVASLEDSWSNTLTNILLEDPIPAKCFSSLEPQIIQYESLPQYLLTPSGAAEEKLRSYTLRSLSIVRRLSSRRKKVKRSSLQSTLSVEYKCSVRHEFYCPSTMKAESLFYDYRVARQFAHLFNSESSGKDIPRGGRTSAKGDFNVLRDRKERKWNRWSNELDGMKEPRSGGQLVDIFSVLEG
jgi:hypothetical protein